MVCSISMMPLFYKSRYNLILLSESNSSLWWPHFNYPQIDWLEKKHTRFYYTAYVLKTVKILSDDLTYFKVRNSNKNDNFIHFVDDKMWTDLMTFSDANWSITNFQINMWKINNKLDLLLWWDMVRISVCSLTKWYDNRLKTIMTFKITILLIAVILIVNSCVKRALWIDYLTWTAF